MSAAAPRGRSLWGFASHPASIAALTALITSATPRAYASITAALNPDRLPAEISALQDRKWDANPACGVGQNFWHPRADNSVIDATICPGTGDILVSIKDYKGKMTQYWPALAPAHEAGTVNAQVAVGSLFESAAHASIPPVNRVPAKPVAGVALVQDVTCQVRLDSNHIKRRLRRPDGTCIDIVIDTSTGQTVSSVAVSCSAAC